MRILISGASGFVGTALAQHLEGAGHTVARLVRRVPASPHEIRWDPARGSLDPAALEGFEGVVHLSGEGIAEERWTPARKQRLWSSRIESTRLLSETIARLDRRPRVLVSMSAVGYYGDRGDEELTEASSEGRGFLTRLARAWEQAAEPAQRGGVRVVHPRMGIVLGANGGALAKMLTPFRFGVGGPIGNGRAWWSWIALDDAVAAVEFVLRNDMLGGAVNFTGPHPVRNAEFARALGAALGRPAFFPVPALALRAMFGEMANEALLASARVLPARLLAAGYTFRHPHLESALGAAMGRAAVPAAA